MSLSRDVLGHLVSSLVNEQREAGYHSVAWDGKAWNGEQVASGVYLARFVVTNELGSVLYAKTNRLLLMK